MSHEDLLFYCSNLPHNDLSVHYIMFVVYNKISQKGKVQKNSTPNTQKIFYDPLFL